MPKQQIAKASRRGLFSNTSSRKISPIEKLVIDRIKKNIVQTCVSS